MVIPSEVITFSSPRPVPGIFYSTIFPQNQKPVPSYFREESSGGLESMNRNYLMWQLCLILIALC